MAVRRFEKKKYSLRHRSVNAGLSSGRGECSDEPSLGASFVVDIRRRLLLYRYTAPGHESTAFRDKITYIGGLR